MFLGVASAAIGAKDDRDTIVVESVTFDEKIKESLDAAASAAPASAPSSLLTYARMGIGAVVLLLVLLFLRKSLKTTTEQVNVPAAAAPRRSADGTVFDLDAMSSSDVPSELRLLDAEPEALANALRSWVADRREVAR